MVGLAQRAGRLAIARAHGTGWTGCARELDIDGVRSCVRQYRLRRAPAHLVLDRQAFRLLPTEAPDVPVAEQNEAVRWQIADLVDFDVTDAVVEHCPMGDSNRHDGKHMIYAVAAPRDAVRDAIQQGRRAGLRILRVGIPELALRNLASHLAQPDQGIALLYAEADGATVVLVRDGRLFVTRRVEVQLHHEGGNPLDSVLLEIQRALDYFDGHFAHPPIRQLVVMGDDPVEDEAVQHLGGNLRMEARSVPLDHLAPGAEAGGPGCAFATGAALGVAG
ncbi:MAG: type IV pilus biogenesis protein PilM [Pseudomonadota bacterium]